MVQVIRYTDTPVGPYDELVVVPGSFGYRRETASGNRKIMKEEKNQRATRVYVSQKQTCWNGRKSQFLRVSHMKSCSMLIIISRLEYTEAPSSLLL